ncbi:MAG: CDP-diacylglycerol--serine O-phosphatidyltransferase [Bacteroidota bacterium]
MRITRAVVPSLFTTLNIFCGFLSIVSAHQGQIQNAAWFIILAAIFDSLDGVMARITKSSSQFGVELDSLADVVSFGAAPSFMAYQAFLHSFDNVGIVIASLPLVFGAIRLARFNVQLVGFDKDYFKGLPIPAQAMTLCTFMLQYYGEIGLTGWAAAALAPIVIVLSFLMVSRIKYDTLPKLTKKQLRAHPWKIVGFVLLSLIVIFSKGGLFFPVMSAYIVFGILRALFQWLKKIATGRQKEIEKENGYSSIDI